MTSSSLSSTAIDRSDHSEFPHLMLKEIYQQPEVLRTCLAAYLTGNRDVPINLNLPIELYNDLDQIHLIACGTSRHAGLVAQHWLEQITGIPTRIRSGSEFVSAPLPIATNTLTIGITQSGETADTLKALTINQTRRSELGDRFQARQLGITNQPNSSLAQLVDHILPTWAGTEIGVAATKTFTTQLAVLCCLMLDLAVRRGVIVSAQLQQWITVLQQLPEQIARILEQEGAIKDLAQQLVNSSHCIILGQGVNRAIALEGALKLKETTYIHAEGYAAGEFLHGPIALLDQQIPVIAIAPEGSSQAAVLETVRKVQMSGAKVIGIVSNREATPDLFEDCLVLPAIANELISPFLTVIPLQLLAYHIAVLRGLDVDRPRNLTKAITV
ncbi:isomerizing glutamine--fructose-6-phosphate transaminase [Pantanalinema sp. GBBB05]|uniref:isomerizing glutamine--fructose-6-phosphate transaminase n=1 Tax=Pantanalinema sp. GBBB05 TaxID=2604139 RepID=UPI003D812FEE